MRIHAPHAPVRWVIHGMGLLLAAFMILVVLIQHVQMRASDPRPFWIVVALAVAIGGGLYFFLPMFVRRSIARNIRKKLVDEGLEGVVVGTCTMELSGNRLATKTRLGDSSIDLRVIKDIIEYDDYALVYLTSTQIHVIPLKHDVLPEEDYRFFFRALRSAWLQVEDEHKSPPDHRITGWS